MRLVDTTDREEARCGLQRPLFERVMGRRRTFENLQQSYFPGATAEIVERIRDLEAGGIQDLVLAPCDCDLGQLERFASESPRASTGAERHGPRRSPRVLQTAATPSTSIRKSG
jgi:hypothetical protein